MVEPARIPELRSGGLGPRVFRIAALAALVFAVEWRMASPFAIATEPTLRWTPWSLLFLMFPVALGVWAYEATDTSGGLFKVDFLWAVLAGTLGYVAAAFVVAWL